MNKLYENIRNRRKELKMTRSELAKALGYADRSLAEEETARKVAEAYEGILSS